MKRLNDNSVRRGGRLGWTAAVVACGLFGLTTGQSFAQPTFEYHLKTIPTLGGENAMALDVNDYGMVVGWAETEQGQEHAFLYNLQTGTMTDLGTMGGVRSEARSINNYGEYVGVAVMPDGTRRAFYGVNGRIFDLNRSLNPWNWVEVEPTADGGTAGGECQAPFTSFVEALAINDLGHIVGCGTVLGDDYLHGFILRPEVGFGPNKMPLYSYENLGELPGALGCVPYGLNNFDEVVGISGLDAFHWWNGEMTYLDPGMTFHPVPETQANAISDMATAVGRVYDETMMLTACMWREGNREPLTYLPGWMTEALDVNDVNQVVGWASGDYNQLVAIRWQGGEAVDLNTVTAIPVSTPGWDPEVYDWDYLRKATAINNNGWIVGYGDGTDGTQRAYVLIPMVIHLSVQR